MFILPIFTNTGAATLQLVCAGRVMGTFPIVKGANTPLAAGDIVKDSPLVVVFSTALSCFSVVNPVNGLFDMARFLEKAQNLADLVDKGAARNNLGLGKLALEDDYPKGSLSQKGIVQLSNAIDSDSETMAATPKAVKAAMDLVVSSSVKSVNGKKGEVNLTSDDIGAFAKTGGTVNGAVIVEGNQLVLKGDDRKHLGFHNQDGSVRMWLYKDKGGDGIHLNNGEDGGGDWLFHKNGNFHAPAGIFAGGNVTVSWGGRSAIFHENGDVTGPIWGGALSAWLNNQLNNRGTKNTAQKAQDGWWQCGDTGVIEQWGRAKIEGDYGVIRFPREFTSGCWNVVIIPENSNTRVSVGERGRTSFNVSMSMSVSGRFFLWRAIGE